MPLVAQASSSTEFDNPKNFPYFLRTCSSDQYHAQLIAAILARMNWYKVTVIWENNAFGYGMKTSFDTVINRNYNGINSTKHICVDHYLDITENDFSNAKARIRDLTLVSNEQPYVILVFAQNTTSINLYRQLMEMNLDYQFVWATGSINLIPDDLSDFLNGTIATEIGIDPLLQFEHSLIDVWNKRDALSPFYAKLVEQVNQCCLPLMQQTRQSSSAPSTTTMSNQRCPYASACDQDMINMRQLFNGSYLMSILRQAQMTFDAVHVLYKSILNIQQNECGRMNKHLCPEFKEDLNGPYLYATIYKMATTGDFNPKLKSRLFYNDSYSAAPNYMIAQYQSGAWIMIGKSIAPPADNTTNETVDDNQSTWTPNPFLLKPKEVTQLAIEINDSLVMKNEPLWSLINQTQSECLCSNCQINGYNWYRKPSSQCCYYCEQCGSYQRLPLANESFQCVNCPNRSVPSENYTDCVLYNMSTVLSPMPISMICVLVLTVLLCILSIWSTIIFVRHYMSPIMLASTRVIVTSLSIMLALLSASSWLLLPMDSAIICAAGWTISTTLLAACHALNLVRAIRFGRPTWYVNSIQKCDQMLVKYNIRAQPKYIISGVLTLFCVLIQIICAIIWCVIFYPRIEIMPRTDVIGYYYWCSSDQDATSMMLICCPLFYMIISGWYLRAGLRSHFNYPVWQTRFGIAGWLCFAMLYTTMIPLFFLMPEEPDVGYKASFIIVLFLVSGATFWCATIFPVIYMLLVRKELNTIEYTERRRSHHFMEGNTVFFVDSYTLPVNRSQARRHRRHRKQLVTQLSIDVETRPRMIAFKGDIEEFSDISDIEETTNEN